MDNPILYRYWLLFKRRGPRGWAGLLIYPAWLLLPTLLTSGRRPDVYALTVCAHLAYFCLRSLLGASQALAAERQGLTLESLATTRTSLREVLQGRLLVVLAPRLLELGLFGPLLLALPGHPAPAAVMGLLLMTAAYTLSFTILGLWLSAGSRTRAQAQARALGLFALTFVGLWLGSILCSDFGQPWLMLPASLLDPGIAWLPLMGNYYDLPGAWICGLSPLIFLALSALAWRATLGKLGRAPSARPARQRVRRLPGWLGQNPVLYRQLSAHPSWAFLSFPVLVFWPWAVMVTGGQRSRVLETIAVTLCLQAIWVSYQSINGGAAAFTAERERGTWESLLSTPLSSWQLVWGKFLAGVLPVLAQLLVFCPLWLLLYDHPGALLYLGIHSAIMAGFLVSLGLWFSARGRSTAVAALSCYMVLTLLTVGTLCADVLVDGEGLVGFLSPVWAEFSNFAPGDHYGWVIYNPILYALACPLLLALTYRQLRRLGVR